MLTNLRSLKNKKYLCIKEMQQPENDTDIAIFTET